MDQREEPNPPPGEDFPDSEQVPSSLAEISITLRVAKELHPTHPRVAFSCVQGAHQQAFNLDRLARGDGVLQFMILLSNWLNRNKNMNREGLSDYHKVLTFYTTYYRSNIKSPSEGNHGSSSASATSPDSFQLTKACQTAVVLNNVITALWSNRPVTTARDVQTLKDFVEINAAVEKLTQTYKPYNIIPLDPLSINHAIRRIPEIKDAVTVLRNGIDDLEWPEPYDKNGYEDMLDWLQAMFGFQKDNVSNQRENLILLLANVQSRKFPTEEQPDIMTVALDTVMNNLLENYLRWYKFLDLEDKNWSPHIEQKIAPQRKLLYIGLYLLIWGEAANLRFMPECLCYIYHHMAFELFEMLEKRVNEETRERIKPAYGGGDEAFLEKVVTPIYRTIYMEAQRGKGGKHSEGRNYDDLNEYFWLKSSICNEQEWLKETDHVDFFCKILRIHQAKWEKLIASPTNPTFDTIHFIIKPKKIGRDQPEVGDVGHSASDVVSDASPAVARNNAPVDPTVPNNVPHDAKKVHFIETRSFLHLFRSFKRMWTFYILALQTMIIIAWNESGELCTIYQCEVLHQVLSIFITIAILEIIQAILDIYLMSWKARYCMTSYMHLRYFSKAVMAAIWAVVFPITYFSSNLSHSYFIMAISIYVFLSMPTLVLFLCPCLETCDNILVKLIMWWYQPQLYVGRGTRHKNAWSFIKYTMFWIVLLFFKSLFSYYAEIRPLVGPTKEIMQLPKSVYHLSELFPSAMNQIVIMITLWSPVILVYFMDTQIWYAILSTLTGGVIGFFMRLGEVQTLAMLRTRFQFLSRLFNDCLVPKSEQEPAQIEVPQHIQKIIKQTRFGQMWNTIISSLREEDLIDDREMELLLVPDWKKMDASENEELVSIHWPIFLLANKIPIALELAKYSKGRAMEFKNTLDGDVYMFSAVKECYASFKIILKTLVSQAEGAETIDEIFLKVDTHIEEDSLIRSVDWNALPVLYNQFVQLTEYLEKNTEDKYIVAVIVMKMLNVVILDMMKEECIELRTEIVLQKFVNLQLPLGTHIEDWQQKIKRLRLLLTVKDSAMDVPSNLEARRRLTFFSNSLLMDIPRAPKIHNMLSFSVLTPYFEEDVLFSTSVLENPNDDGVSILFYLENIFPDEWRNFQERINNSNLNLGEAKKLEEKRLWASYRGQTLTKTVRGMMYYRKALELQASFDQVSERRVLMQGSESGSTISSDCQALADMKFTYVVACQKYSIHKGSGDPRAKDILRLMTTYPSLRVAYIDELVRPLDEGSDEGTIKTVYYSTLVKVASETTNPQQRDKAQDQVIYRIKLPGDPIIGEGKPENQNHAIIFTRGEALQTIDMNQDNYIEEAFKMRNLLQEFIEDRGDLQRPTILGLREHIFTGSVSSLAWFMSNQENTFVTLGQRVLASPLRVRFHYGHPDVFDRVFHLTRGGVSKASKTINLSEDIFAGFNSILRGGSITHHEYIQVGKGRDVGLNQISVFEAKIANGSGEQTLSRDIYRMGHQFDFFRMLSCYFTTVGFYFCSLLTVLTVYVFLYGRLYLVLSGLEEEMWNHPAIRDTTALQAALTSQSLMQFGFLMAFPMIMAIGLERGFHNALFDIVLMQLQLAPVFFTFQLGTKAHYYSQTLFHGGAKYKATGRGFVVFHEKFSDNYMHYSRSHFVKAFELKILLLVYHMFGQAYMGSLTYFLIMFSIWFMVGSWLFAPFLFNPSGFEWHKIVDDWIDWKKWIYEYNFGGFGVRQENSWECWWEKELQPLQQSGKMGTILEIVFALRFFIFQCGLVSQLTPFENCHTLWVYVVSVSLILIIILIVTVLSRANRGLSTNSQSVYRTFKAIMFITVFTVLITLTALHLVTLKDIFLCLIAFIITGWGMLLIAQACKHRIQRPWILSSVRTLAWGYDLLMGFLLFIPIALLAWFPFVSDFQTRILFNQAFSRGLQISHILGHLPRTRSENRSL